MYRTNITAAKIPASAAAPTAMPAFAAVDSPPLPFPVDETPSALLEAVVFGVLLVFETIVITTTGGVEELVEFRAPFHCEGEWLLDTAGEVAAVERDGLFNIDEVSVSVYV